MTHRGRMIQGDKTPGLGLFEDADISSLAPTKG